MPEVGKEDLDATKDESPPDGPSLPDDMADCASAPNNTIEADSPPKTDGEEPALSAGANLTGPGEALEPKDHSDRGFGKTRETSLPILPPEVEALFRKIAKEEIGKALGHTIA